MIVAILVGRGGSVGIPKKNVYPILNRPLMSYPILAAQNSKFVDEVYVSTDSEDIIAVGKKFGTKIINRPPELATNDALIEIYRKQRPGDPPTIDTATNLFHGMFFDPRKYDFSRVGRLKFNIKLDLDIASNDSNIIIKEALKGLKRTFAMYVKFPRDRWKEISIAERDTPSGDKMWKKLSEEYQETYFSNPSAVDITDQGNPVDILDDVNI